MRFGFALDRPLLLRVESPTFALGMRGGVYFGMRGVDVVGVGVVVTVGMGVGVGARMGVAVVEGVAVGEGVGGATMGAEEAGPTLAVAAVVAADGLAVSSEVVVAVAVAVADVVGVLFVDFFTFVGIEVDGDFTTPDSIGGGVYLGIFGGD